MTLCMIRLLLGTYNWLSEIALDRYADQKGIDAFANWLGTATQWISGNLRKVQNGFVRSYALSVMLGVVIILGYLDFEINLQTLEGLQNLQS